MTPEIYFNRVAPPLPELHWLDITKRIIFKNGLLSYESVVGQAPKYSQELFSYSHPGHSLNLIIPHSQTAYGSNSFSVIGPKLLNRLPKNVTSVADTDSFKGGFRAFNFEKHNFELWAGGDGRYMYPQFEGGFGTMHTIPCQCEASEQKMDQKPKTKRNFIELNF